MPSIPEDEPLTQLSKSLSGSTLPKGWTLCSDIDNSIVIVKVLIRHVAPIFMCVVIDENFLWHIYVNWKPVSANIPLFKNTPPKISTSDEISSLLQLINSSSVCAGNHGSQYETMREWQTKKFLNKKST